MNIDIFLKVAIFGAILLASILALAIIIERLIFFKQKRTDADTFSLKIKDILSKGSSDKVDKAIQLCHSFNSPVARLTNIVLSNIHKETEDIEKLVQVEAQREIPLLEQRLTALNTIGSIAPLLGLLGTVTGMIASFGAISQGDLVGDSKAGTEIAKGIETALTTTAAGLVVAIPCIITYNFFSRKVEKLINEMEIHSTELIDFIKSQS
jgi:biopolymer transport protein ExbB